MEHAEILWVCTVFKAYQWNWCKLGFLLCAVYCRMHISQMYALEHLVDSMHYKPEGCRFGSQWGCWNFSLTRSFAPGVNSTCNSNEYQGYLLEGKGGWQAYHPHVPIV